MAGDLAGAQLLANLLALPQTITNDRVQTAQMRGLLRQMGTPEETINTYAPGDDTAEPLGGTGVAGKILSGVGKTGAVLSTVLGAPIKAPRVDLAEAKSAGEMGLRKNLADMEPDPKKKALIMLGQYNAGLGSDQPKNLIGLLYKQGQALGYNGDDLTNYVFTQYPKMQANIAGQTSGARKGATTDIDTARKQWEDENKRRQLNGQQPLPPPPGGFGDEGSDASDPATSPKANLGLTNATIPKVNVNALSPLDDRFTAAEQKYSLPPGILPAVAETESGFDPTAQGPRLPEGDHAIGLMQFRPATAKRFGIDPTNPDQSIDGAGRYLRQLIDEKQGNLQAALQAYGGAVTNDYAGPVLARRNKYMRALMLRDAPDSVVANLTPDQKQERDDILARFPKSAPVQVASADGTIGYPPPAPGPEDTRGLKPRPLPQPAPQPAPAPAPAIAPNQQIGMSVQPEPTLEQPPAGPGVPPTSGGLPITGKTTDVGGVKYEYGERKHIPGWTEAATRLQIDPNTEDPAKANKVMDLVREENRRGEKMDLFDLASFALGLPARGPYAPQDAERMRSWMRAYEAEPTLRGQMARMRVVRQTLETLKSPVQEQDINTLQPKVDADGNPVYVRNPDTGNYVTPIEELTNSRVLATLPWAQAISLDWKRKGAQGAAVNQLMMASGEMANFVKAAGDSGNASEQEQATQLRAFIPNDRDTVESALFKVNQGLARAARYEEEFSSRFRDTGGTDNTPDSRMQQPGGRGAATGNNGAAAGGIPTPTGKPIPLREYLRLHSGLPQ